MINERTDHSVITGVLPVAYRLSDSRSILQIVQIIQHIPRTIDIEISKMITIVPGLDLLCFLRLSKICQQPVYLRLGETKIFVESCPRYGIRHKIIGSGKYALLGNAKASSYNGKA